MSGLKARLNCLPRLPAGLPVGSRAGRRRRPRQRAPRRVVAPAIVARPPGTVKRCGKVGGRCHGPGLGTMFAGGSRRRGTTTAAVGANRRPGMGRWFAIDGGSVVLCRGHARRRDGWIRSGPIRSGSIRFDPSQPGPMPDGPGRARPRRKQAASLVNPRFGQACHSEVDEAAVPRRASPSSISIVSMAALILSSVM